MVDKRKPPRAKAKKPPVQQGATPSAKAVSPTGCSGWVWWRSAKPPETRSPVKQDYFNDRKIPKAVRAEFDTMRTRYKTGGLRNGANIKNIGDGIYELRYSHIGNTPFRLLFMRYGEWAVVLDVFKKTTDATPKDRAMQRRKAWLDLFGPQP